VRFRSALLIFLVSSTVLILGWPTRAEAQSLTIHSPIFITSVGGVENFTSAAGVTSGSGTPPDPYVIEGWEISTSSAFGIHIRNTKSFFIIRNLRVEGTRPAGLSSGIFLENVQNGLVDRANVTGFTYGVVISVGTSNAVENSNIWNNTDGIYLQGSNQLIKNDHLYNNTEYGALITSSTFNVIRNNNSSDNGDRNNGAGFFIIGSNNIFDNNTVSENSWFGIRMVGAPFAASANNVFSNNTISRNGGLPNGGGICGCDGAGLVFSNNATANQIVGNKVTDQDNGIGLESEAAGDYRNNITLNTVVRNRFGIYVVNGGPRTSSTTITSTTHQTRLTTLSSILGTFRRACEPISSEDPSKEETSTPTTRALTRTGMESATHHISCPAVRVRPRTNYHSSEPYPQHRSM